MVLLTGAGLLWRSFYFKYSTDLVIDTSDLLAGRLALPVSKYDTPAKRHEFFERLQERLESLSIFSSTTLASQSPLAQPPSRFVDVDGLAVNRDANSVSYVYSGERYFETLGLRLLRGRSLTESAGPAGR
jgi:hypothetical protein